MKKLLFFIFIVLFCAGAFAQESPKIAVYVTGDVPNNEKEALGTRILTSLVNSGRYIAIERSKAFLAEIEKEHVKQRSGDIDDSQISALGKQFGVKFVCIAAITPAFDAFQVSARIVNVETAVVVFIGESASPLKTLEDLALVSDQVVKNMFGSQTDNIPARGTEYAIQPKQEKVVAGSARKPKYVYDVSKDFTTGERYGTWALNTVPGLGSAVIMKDYKGAIINAVIGGGSGAFFLSNSTLLSFALWIGCGSAWNIHRSFTYHHPDSRKVATTPQQGLNIAVLPDQDGNIKGYVAYRVEF